MTLEDFKAMLEARGLTVEVKAPDVLFIRDRHKTLFYFGVNPEQVLSEDEILIRYGISLKNGEIVKASASIADNQQENHRG